MNSSSADLWEQQTLTVYDAALHDHDVMAMYWIVERQKAMCQRVS